jgi:choline dehydrogenase-like flavoprotein
MDVPEISDYIIVGGGLTGCALATRLVGLLDPSCSILLLEAVSDPSSNPSTTTPMEGFALQDSELDWEYATAPVPSTTNCVITFPAGKALGGGSVLNYGGWARVMQAITMHGLELWEITVGAK